MIRTQFRAVPPESAASNTVGVVDSCRLGIWVRFTATLEERAGRPVVAHLSAVNDDGVEVPIGRSEHASIVWMFTQSYYRWREKECRNLPAQTAP